MADIVIDQNGVHYLTSVNTPDYLTGVPANKADMPSLAKEGVVINPDLKAVKGVPQRYWKLEDGKVVEMSQLEKDTLASQLEALIEEV